MPINSAVHSIARKKVVGIKQKYWGHSWLETEKVSIKKCFLNSGHKKESRLSISDFDCLLTHLDTFYWNKSLAKYNIFWIKAALK